MHPLTLYATVLLAAFGEASAFVGLLVPGVGVVLGAGVVAARGGADPLWVGGLASLGSIAGFGLSYHLGRAGGPRVARWSRRTQAALGRARAFFDRHGAWSVFLGHFFGPLRALVAFTAGAADLAPRRFWLASMIGGLVWGYGLALGGIVLAGGWALVEARFGRASLVMALVAALVYLGFRLATGALLLGLRLLPSVAQAAVRYLSKVESSLRLGSLLGRDPRLARWLARRLVPDRSTGLLLAAGALTCLASAWLLFGVVEGVVLHTPLERVDQKVLHLLQALRTPEADRLFVSITYLGNVAVVASAVLASVLALMCLGRKFEAVLLVVAFGAGQALTWAIKLGAGRARPVLDSPLLVETSGAFPSNHAFSSLALYGFLAYLAGRALSSRSRARLYAVVGVAVSAIGLSRLYLGVHWMTDVVAGYALGAVWLTAVVTAAEVRRQFGPARSPVSGTRAWLSVVATVAAVATAWGVETGRHLDGDLVGPDTTFAAGSPLGGTLSSRTRTMTPHPVETLLGTPVGTPQTFVVGTGSQILEAARSAGWISTRPLNVGVLLTEVARAFSDKPDPAAPVPPRFWKSRPQDFALARAVGTGRRVIRLWRMDPKTRGGQTAWAGWERLQAPARSFFGIPLPGTAETGSRNGASDFVKSLATSGRYRECPSSDAVGANVLVPSDVSCD